MSHFAIDRLIVLPDAVLSSRKERSRKLSWGAAAADRPMGRTFGGLATGYRPLDAKTLTLLPGFRMSSRI